MGCDIKEDCGGCRCHTGKSPCTHCIEDHDNIYNYPECENCGYIFYEETENEILQHHLKGCKVC